MERTDRPDAAPAVSAPRVAGRTAAGEAVHAYDLGNARGMTASVLTYGGIVQSLRVPDARGASADVVLGFAGLEPYLGSHPHFGAITGRVAGRITGGRFTVDGREYALACNDGGNHLHGGFKGLDKRVWHAEAENGALVLRYRSPDGEEGYPGTADLAVSYRLTDDNELVIDTEVTVDRATPVSLTNHSYFNLAGEGEGTVEDHVITITAGEYVPTDGQLTLSGRREPVGGQANDLRSPRRLGDVIPGLHRQHGDHYLPPASGGAMRRVARVSEPRSGRVMDVSTDDDGLQFYTGWFLDGSVVGKSGRAYPRFGGFCLECQGYPDGADHPGLGAIIVRPGEPRRRRTVYAFSVSAA
jgi:aldose 1-epimerase